VSKVEAEAAAELVGLHGEGNSDERGGPGAPTAAGFEPEAELDSARMLVELGGDRARALELARTAREGLRARGPDEATAIAELDAWIAETSSQAPPRAGPEK
jgi:hypothetical protein